MNNEAPGVTDARHALTLMTDKGLLDLMDEQNRLIDKEMAGTTRTEVDRLMFYYRLSLAECRRRALGY